MARPEKVAVVEEVRDELADNPATLLTEYRGLTVSELAELRGALREAGARYVVVKNTLARIAARDAGYEALEEMLTGPTALTYCDEDPVGPAKALRSFAKDHPELVVKGGILEGRIVDAETAAKLADLESREDLLGKLAGMLYGALANAASLFQAPVTDMARLVAALEEKGEAPAGEPQESTDEPEIDEPETAEATTEDEPEDAAAEAEQETGAETEDEPQDAATEEAEDEPQGAATEEAEEDPAEATSDAVEAVTDVAAEAVEAAGDAAASAAEATGDAVGGDDAAETVASAVEGAAEAASGAVSAAGEAAGNAAGAVVDAVTDDEDDEDDQEDEAEASETSDEDDTK